MQHNIYGYIRVSSRDQNEDRQLIAMNEAGVPEENIFIDKQSGKDFKRPQYRKMVRRLEANDVVYVKSIDRLGSMLKPFAKDTRVTGIYKDDDDKYSLQSLLKKQEEGDVG